MSFDHDTSWDSFQKILSANLSIKEGWKQIIDFHEKIKKKNYWTELRNLNLEQEQEEIKEWIESLVKDEPIDKKVVSLWIGINKFLDNTGKEVYAIYLLGCHSYDKGNIEWATEPAYGPGGRYFVSDVLNEIDDKIKNGNKDYSFLDWILPLAYISLTIDDLIRSNLDTSNLLKYQNKIYVTAGFDGGDFMNLKAVEK